MTGSQPPEIAPTRRQWLGLLAIALGVALIVVDTTIVNVIVPSIIEDLDTDSTQAQWIQESYAIVFAALLLVVGRVADILGARRVFIAGVIVFGVTSILAGLASGSDLLIIARFLQGAGAAMILPTSLALLNATFTGKSRGQAFAIWGSTIGAAAALGPLLGGWLAEHVSWRWAFGINVPLAVLIVIGIVTCMDRSPRIPGRIDVVGAVLSVIGLGLLAFGLIEGRTYGWTTTTTPLSVGGFTWGSGPSPVFVSLVVSAFAIVGFVVRQAVLRRGGNSDKALMDLGLFSVSSFRNGNVATLIIGVGEFGVVAVLPLWLQFTLGYSALQAGLALVPIAIGSFIASGASFGLADRDVTPLTLLRAGLAFEVVGLAALALFAKPDSSWWTLALILAVYGIGVGFATAQVTNVVLADVPETDNGQAAGIQSAFRQLGSALGIAILTTVFFTTLGSRVSDQLTADGMDASEAGQHADTITSTAGAAIEGFAAAPGTAPVADAGRVAMTDGIMVGGYIAAGFVFLGLVASLLIPAMNSAAAKPSAPAAV
ncbi:DHA2 family efflux MFS transporter permease subunit [Gordonia sp. PDNC005]|uniref:DHA2 family efflux MFS transporter permease subunit n=1 Tax=unclassified Gordonia (in: high G+C Gram-positive bacteria) TaxID=2657482 RepID=UPI001963D397|nr:DHA2 family efflux MFS transporter permease subunit [Gordonia sp. PDNC005]QRY62014.1 DHA2 family efflux MFS transporter permease subunit [Gordonia sp. PDNC005]